jgi:hypothetical protein
MAIPFAKTAVASNTIQSAKLPRELISLRVLQIPCADCGQRLLTAKVAKNGPKGRKESRKKSGILQGPETLFFERTIDFKLTAPPFAIDK